MGQLNNNGIRDKHAAKKMSQGKMRLMLNAPFWGGLSVRFPMVEDYNCNTAWINGRDIGYNPEWINTLSVKECEGLIAHEVGHVIFLHHLRRGERDPGEWNQAGDYVINPIVQDSGLILPPNPLLLDQYRGKSTEAVYDIIHKDTQDKSGQGTSQGNGSQGQGQGKDDGNSTAADGSDKGAKSDENSKGNETSKDFGTGSGEVRDLPGDSEGQEAGQAEIKQHEAEIKVMIAQAVMGARAVGTLPAGLSRIIDEILEPAISLKSYLRQFIDRSCQSDYTFMKPNLRYSTDFIMPSLQADGLGNIIFALDTSGSVNRHETNQYAAIITDVLEEFHQDATIIYCDTQVYEDAIEHFSRYDLPVTLHPKGGGGTEFQPVFDYVDKHDLSPLCLVYFTDLQGNFNIDPEPGYPVLWVQYDPSGYSRRLTPKVGEVIRVRKIA